MITGRQIRSARASLHWTPRELAERAKVEISIVARAENVEGEPPITFAQAAKIEGVLKSAGIAFVP